MTWRKFLVRLQGLTPESLFVRVRDWRRRNPPPVDATGMDAAQIEALLAEQDR